MTTRANLLVATALTCALGSLSSQPLANPYVEPQPAPVLTLEELRAAIDGAGGVPRRNVWRQLAQLWDGERDLLLEALHGERPGLQKAAARALLRIGDADALASLRAVLADTSVAFGTRIMMGQALAAAADTSALKLLRELLPAAQARHRVYGGAVELMIRKIERPDTRRPLILKGEHFLEYRFLLDDIASIYTLDDPLTFTSDGQIYCPHAYGPQARHDFSADQFQTICDLLQEGRYSSPGMLMNGELLVIELRDRRHVAVNREGDTFWIGGEWSLGWRGFVVKAESLAHYIDRMREQ